jgi:DNA gyrase subunit A
MAKQLNIIRSGQIISTALHQEMQQSYLEYAMSVIVGRALPDVRDGLKPVHRRILYAMHELGLTPDRPFRKCARVVGDVLGKYHPHGDQSVYDALVRLVQEFSSRYPLLGGHGNFGSVDNDPPAAMRYTETRLASIGNTAMLTEIGEATVEFVGNFDNSQQEPTVLPAQLPFLLLNGSSGIAVGMATNIPPHNLNEVVDGLIALIDNPELPDEKLLKIIPGPDFPTGGEIIGLDGIREAYLTGRGSITVRGVHHMEEVPVGKGKHRRSAIIITELPFQVNKASLIEKIAELVNNKKIEGIADLRDESDREGIRVVIELKREGNITKILEGLHRQTALQNTFGTIMLALSDGIPHQMTLREVLNHFLTFREETLTKRYTHELDQTESRQHIVEGWLLALSNLDDLIDILRNSPDGGTAKLALQNRFDMSDRQADAVLGMPLRRLTGMERTNLQTEFDELTTKVAGLRKVLDDRHELLKALKKDLRSLKKQFGDARKTRIIDLGTPLKPIKVRKPKPTLEEREAAEREAREAAELAAREAAELADDEPIEVVSEDIDSEDSDLEDSDSEDSDSIDEETDEQAIDPLELRTDVGTNQFELTLEVEPEIPSSPKPKTPTVPKAAPKATPKAKPAPDLLNFDREVEVVVEISQDGHIRRTGQTLYDNTTHRSVLGSIPIPAATHPTQTEFLTVNDTLMVLTSSGKVYPLLVKDIPPGSGDAQGTSIVTLLPSSASTDAIASVFLLPDDLENQALLLLTQQGKIKRIALSDFPDLNNRGLVTIKLKEDDQVLFAGFVEEGDQVVVATSMGRVIRVEINEETLPIAARTAAGTQVTKVLKLERFVGWAIAGYEDEFMMMTREGYSKRMTVGLLKLCNLGDLGQHVFQFTNKGDMVVGMIVAFPGTIIRVKTDRPTGSVVTQLAVEAVPLASRDHKGTQPLNLVVGETVSQLTIVS